MTEVVWENLAKTVTDKTKISEEIDADLVTHNEDPSAHKQTGEAIDTHRVAEILDHLDKSVTVGKLDFDKLLFTPTFESLDGWLQGTVGTGAAILIRVGACRLTTGNAVGNITKVFIEGLMGSVGFDDDPWFQASIDFSTSPEFQDVAVGVGSSNPWAPTDFFGFRWSKVDSKMYAYHFDNGVETKTQIVGFDTGIINTLRAEMTGNGTVVKFYVNGILKVTHTGASIGMDSDNYFCFANRCQSVGNNLEAYIRNIVFSKGW